MTDVAGIASDEAAIPASRLRGPALGLVMILGTAGILLNINRLFNLQFFIGKLLIDTSYFYLLAGTFLSLVFLVYPYRSKSPGPPRWFDWALFALTLAAAGYLAFNGERIVEEGWDLAAPLDATIVAGVICAVTLEAVRRVGGPLLFGICLFFFAFPLFADRMPGFLWGASSDFPSLLRLHAMGTESIIGVPMRVVAGLLIGFLVFGSALVATGGGEFFMTFATALMGKTRGGPAKVAILSSGLFGSLSGSVISNVVTTGQMTIPTMKRVGYPAAYAGAVEACASTGGALMPPVMGAVAFIMAEYLNISYATVMIAAVVPAFLFYIALLFQADMYAVSHNLKGQPAEEIPNLWETVKSGWHFLLSLVLLIYLLVWVGIEAHAPFYATVLLVATSAVNGAITGKNPVRFDNFKVLISDSVKNITNIVGILAGIGMIVGSLSYTGVGGAFSRELVQFAGSNVYLLLLFGAVTSFVLGMGMTVSACYIFLAVVLGPALIDSGLDPVASHLFILYWGMLSYITPPVALAAVAAATIANASAMKTGFLAMRLGLINFILPFLFALNPTLILRGEPLSIVHDVATAVLSVWLMASSFEGMLYGAGGLGPIARIAVFAAACGALVPGWRSDLAGVVLVALVYAWQFYRRSRTVKVLDTAAKPV